MSSTTSGLTEATSLANSDLLTVVVDSTTTTPSNRKVRLWKFLGMLPANTRIRANLTVDGVSELNNLVVANNHMRITSARTTPANSSSVTASSGTIFWDANYLYIVTSDNHTKRVALSTFNGTGGGDDLANTYQPYSNVLSLWALIDPDDKANTTHFHVISSITGLQTLLDGKAEIVHTHAIANVTGLQAALDAKPAIVHTHAIANVTGLQAALDGKATLLHSHVIANVTGLQTALDAKPAIVHTHAIANVTGLQAALDAKPAIVHTHAIANVTGLQTALDGKATLLHSHVIANVTGLQTALDGKSNTSHVHSEVFVVAASDETTALTTGAAKTTFRMPYAFTISSVRASVATAPTGNTLIVDINRNGSTIFSTRLTIDATERTSTTAATAAVLSTTAISDDDEMTIDIDQVGSSVAGAGLKVAFYGTR